MQTLALALCLILAFAARAEAKHSKAVAHPKQTTSEQISSAALNNPNSFGATQLNDVPYTFDATKLAQADDAFHFLRSYVDYFYLAYKANRASLPTLASLDNQPGWCVGDAHPENFGVLIQEDDSTVFAANDVDDAGPCPVALDLARFLTAARLNDPSTDIDDLVKAYRHGLEGKTDNIPDVVADMFRDSAKKGERPEKSRVDSNNKLVRNAQTREIDANTASQLTTAYKSLFPRHADLIDAIETSKVGGGSGGLRRYELLVQDKQGLVELELKQEITPSIYPVASSAIPAFAPRIATTLAVEQGPNPSSYDSTFVINSLDMISRPRFAGNIGASLSKNSPKENRQLIEYEAFTLGQTHARSLNGPSWSARMKAVNNSDFERDIDQIAQLFRSKFSSLKP